MEPIIYIDRKTGKRETEEVYGGEMLRFVYGKSMIGSLLRTLSAKVPFFSWLYGVCQKMPWSRKKILPFIKKFNIDVDDFLDRAESYRSFNAFFTRQLKQSCRPISDAPVVMPADARYYFYQDIAAANGFIIKGKKFSLANLIGDSSLAERYAGGSMVMARLCPTDYHRFHFPCDCIPGKPLRINGYLYSVNPFAVKQNIEIFTENKRFVTELKTESLGRVLYIEVGATNVGSVIQTYLPDATYEKGAEKGYFSFGASALILLFEKGRIAIDSDLLEATEAGYEMRCLMGQPLAAADL
ncbi:MAG: phosphatidylserine decarboxylase [Chlamydiia bacterium]|nr:phosphatidylserine decarboxylase [Chlamydiia bacterium]